MEILIKKSEAIRFPEDSFNLQEKLFPWNVILEKLIPENMMPRKMILTCLIDHKRNGLIQNDLCLVTNPLSL